MKKDKVGKQGKIMTRKINTTSAFKKVGQPTKYDSTIHPALIIKIFHEGEGVAAFCAESSICKRTFYIWLETYSDFKEAYELALVKGQRYWESLPLLKPHINHRYWQRIMNGRFGTDRPRLPQFKSMNVRDKMQAIWRAVENGELSLDDARKLANSVLLEVQIEDRAPVATGNIPSREELLKQIAMVDRVINSGILNAGGDITKITVPLT